MIAESTLGAAVVVLAGWVWSERRARIGLVNAWAADRAVLDARVQQIVDVSMGYASTAASADDRSRYARQRVEDLAAWVEERTRDMGAALKRNEHRIDRVEDAHLDATRAADWLSTRKAAEELGCSRSTAVRWLEGAKARSAVVPVAYRRWSPIDVAEIAKVMNAKPHPGYRMEDEA